MWSGTQNPHMLRGDLALLFDVPNSEIEIIRMEAAGCYGRNCADDVWPTRCCCRARSAVRFGCN